MFILYLKCNIFGILKIMLKIVYMKIAVFFFISLTIDIKTNYFFLYVNLYILDLFYTPDMK